MNAALPRAVDVAESHPSFEINNFKSRVL